MKKSENNNSENNNKEFIARLMAVQACYQMSQNKKPIKEMVADYLESGLKINEESDEDKILPHGGLFKKIVLGLHERYDDVESLLKGHISTSKDVEPLLKAVLLCGAYELVAHPKTDAPIIINDYLNISYEFYPKAQSSFVNGILDSLSKTARKNV